MQGGPRPSLCLLLLDLLSLHFFTALSTEHTTRVAAPSMAAPQHEVGDLLDELDRALAVRRTVGRPEGGSRGGIESTNWGGSRGQNDGAVVSLLVSGTFTRPTALFYLRAPLPLPKLCPLLSCLRAQRNQDLSTFLPPLPQSHSRPPSPFSSSAPGPRDSRPFPFLIPSIGPHSSFFLKFSPHLPPTPAPPHLYTHKHTHTENLPNDGLLAFGQ